MKDGTKVWLTQRYAKDAPTPAILRLHGTQKWVHLPNGLMRFGCVEGVDYHRSYDAAVRRAREYRAAWLRELTIEAAEVATLPAIPARAA